MSTRNSGVMKELKKRLDKLERTMPMDPNPMKRLIRAVVLQAVMDELEALQTLREDPNHPGAQATVKETEAFFRSDWGESLSGFHGNWLIRNLRKMVPPEPMKTTGTKRKAPVRNRMTFLEKITAMREQLK